MNENQYKNFWTFIKKNETSIIKHVKSDNIPCAVTLIKNKLLNLCELDFSIFIEYKTHNFIQLPERINNINIFISPYLHNIKNIEIFKKDLDNLFEHYIIDSFNINFLKYKPCNINALLKYNINKTITSDIFSCIPEFNIKHNFPKMKLNLFIDAKYLNILTRSTKKNIDIIELKNNDKKIISLEILIPKNMIIYTFLIEAIGIYNMLFVMENLFLYSNNKHSDLKKIPLFELNDIINDHFTLLNNKKLICQRCHINNIHTKLMLCKCKKVYFCSQICNNHDKNHKNLCC